MVYWAKQKYATRIKFNEKGSPYVHSFIWIFSAPNIENETAYIEFIEKSINAQLTNNLKNHLTTNLAMMKKKTLYHGDIQS